MINGSREEGGMRGVRGNVKGEWEQRGWKGVAWGAQLNHYSCLNFVLNIRTYLCFLHVSSK